VSDKARNLLIVSMLAAWLLVSFVKNEQAPPAPPAPDTPISLKGKFIGASAAEDAATICGLASEIADCIEYDGQRTDPRLKTGVAFDDLRTSARELRCKGESIGSRQPKVVIAIEEYLNSFIGVSGGPADQSQRSKWVTAFREIGRAAEDAAR